jgi:hypothetical protein
MRPGEQVHAMLERFRDTDTDPAVFDTLLWVTHPDLPDDKLLSYLPPQMEAPTNTPLFDKVQDLLQG